jgi:hypothetical protein
VADNSAAEGLSLARSISPVTSSDEQIIKQISVIATKHAYADLERECLINTEGGRGTFSYFAQWTGPSGFWNLALREPLALAAR